MVIVSKCVMSHSAPQPGFGITNVCLYDEVENVSHGAGGSQVPGYVRFLSISLFSLNSYVTKIALQINTLKAL